MITKTELVRRTSMETGYGYNVTSAITAMFLQKVVEAIANGEELRLKGFGRFKVTHSGGKPPPHPRFGGGNNKQEEHCVRFRVHFSKSDTLTRAIKEKYRGKIRSK